MLSFEVRKYEEEKGRCILCNSPKVIKKYVDCSWSKEIKKRVYRSCLHVCGTCYNNLLKKVKESLKRAPSQEPESFIEVLKELGVSVKSNLIINPIIELWRDAVKARFKETPIAMSIEKLERYEACETIAEFLCPLELNELLLTEKKLQEGIPENRLLFVGMANTAEYRWCPLQSFFSSVNTELEFFNSYLVDRIAYSIYLNQLQEFPQDLTEFLDIGEELKFSDVEKILKDISLAQTVENKIIQKLLISMEVLRKLRDHKFAGIVDERLYAEPYPTIRWNFKFKDFIVVGIPDGITEDFVYEFKSTQKESYVKNELPVAQAQADLYGYFFKRRKKRVQIRIRETGEIKTWESDVNAKEAEHVLDGLAKVVEGEVLLPPENERKWKCKACKFKEKCHLV